MGVCHGHGDGAGERNDRGVLRKCAASVPFEILPVEYDRFDYGGDVDTFVTFVFCWSCNCVFDNCAAYANS